MPAYTEERGTGYGTAVRFRSKGAQLAAAQGAVACLIRSVTAHSLRSPHTGMMRYDDAIVRIPAAALSIEDTEMIARLRARGVPVTVTLKMEAQNHGEIPSANVIGELRGTVHPEEIVVISGHIDSWDVGQGAHDDGGGCAMAMEALTVLRKLNLRPRRTVRVVLWTAEEVGLHGAKQYAADHAQELAGHVAAIEADIGCFSPIGYGIDCKDTTRLHLAAKQLGEILELSRAVAPLRVMPGHSAPDVGPLKAHGVIVMGHDTNPARYFDYHHTHADTLDKIDPHELQRNVAVMAVTAYVIADMPQRLGAKDER
jgi:carboxypeptidase Q